MGWKQDRDLLIAETLVKAVKGADAEAPEHLQIMPLEQIKQMKSQREREQFGSATLTDALNAAGAPRPSNVRSNQPE